MSALCVFGGIFAIDPDEPTAESDRRVDWIGGFLVTAGVVLILFVLGQGQLVPQGWKTPCESIYHFVRTTTSGLFKRHNRFVDHRRRSDRGVHIMGAPSRKE
jgi:F0F1-type ATP synthase membrane subunit a